MDSNNFLQSLLTVTAKTRYRHILIGAISSLLLMGFSGQEKFVELEGYLNGRAEAKFRSTDENIKTTLAAGTRGEILETKKLNSGNYGLRVRTLNGTKQGLEFWVYYNVNHPDLKLYEEAPRSWGITANLKNLSTKVVEHAKGVETIRETPAIRGGGDISKKPISIPPKLPTDQETGQNAVDAINHANKNIHLAGIPPTAAQVACKNCRVLPSPSTPAPQPTPRATPVGKMTSGSRPMAAACSQIMDSQGQPGIWGQAMQAIMSENKYRTAYLKADAMGALCPNFNKLKDDQQRLQAWTWLWTALAQEESSCDLTKKHHTTAIDSQGNAYVINPHEGYGLWALEKDRNIRRGRGTACDNIATAEGQARCTIDIMYENQLSVSMSAASGSGSYWGPINRKKTQLLPHMRRFALCFQK